MNFSEYQESAGGTDQNPVQPRVANGALPEPQRDEVIPLLGLVGEVGGLLAEYKKLLRDGTTYRKFHEEVEEELGDILWYVSNVATKFGLSLENIARKNLEKTKDRWQKPGEKRPLYDEPFAENQRLPRLFEYSFEHVEVGGIKKLVLVDRLNGGTTGNPLTDNTYEDDGYRYHDILHLVFGACLGWSPVWRKLLRNRKENGISKRFPAEVDDAEDGGRAQVIEEAIIAASYAYAADHGYLEGLSSVDWHLLRHIKQLTGNLEVKNVTAKEWNDALVRGFEIWRMLRTHTGGVVRGDLTTGRIEFIEPG